MYSSAHTRRHIQSHVTTQPPVKSFTDNQIRVSTNPAQPISRRFPGDIRDIYWQKNSRRLSRDKPYNIRMQVKFVMSINEYVLMSSDQRNANPWDYSDPVHPRTTVQYSALKIARRAKITLLIIKFPGASTKFQEISSISRSNFQELSRSSMSCRHPADWPWNSNQECFVSTSKK